MDTKDKIRKLLALSTSPNENEAKAAMLKAKELMMANKLCEADFNAEDRKLVSIKVGDVSWTTDSGNVWLVEMCKTIAENYFSVSSWVTLKGSRTHTLCITGMKQDAELCAEVIKYTMSFVKSEMNKLIRRNRLSLDDAKSYAVGFTHGLKTAYEEQKEEHEEWALVVGMSEEVKKYSEGLSMKSVKSRQVGRNMYAYTKGLKDGITFSPGAVIEKE